MLRASHVESSNVYSCCSVRRDVMVMVMVMVRVDHAGAEPPNLFLLLSLSAEGERIRTIYTWLHALVIGT